MKFLITLEEDEDGFIVAECPVLPGCVSQGKTREEAIRGYIESLRKHGESIPQAELTEVEVLA